MRKIINGKMYNTKTATLICNREKREGCNWYIGQVYKKNTGEYFLYEYDPCMEWITPLSKEDAKQWIEIRGTVEEYIAEFGEPEE